MGLSIGSIWQDGCESRTTSSTPSSAPSGTDYHPSNGKARHRRQPKHTGWYKILNILLRRRYKYAAVRIHGHMQQASNMHQFQYEQDNNITITAASGLVLSYKNRHLPQKCANFIMHTCDGTSRTCMEMQENALHAGNNQSDLSNVRSI